MHPEPARSLKIDYNFFMNHSRNCKVGLGCCAREPPLDNPPR